MLAYARAAVVLLTSVSSIALAQPGLTGEAQRRYQDATRAYDAGDYETAAREFRAAYELTHHADMLFNVFSAEERAGRLDEAAAALAQYMREAELDAADRASAQERLDRLRARIEEHARIEQERLERERLERERIEREARAPREGPVTGPSWAAVGTLAGAGVLLANFGVFAALSTVESDALASACGSSAGRYCAADQTSALAAYNIVADVSWIVGSAAAVAGLILLFALPPERGPIPAVALVPVLGPEGAGLAIGGRL